MPENKQKPVRYKCLLCGRDQFNRKQPHNCNGQRRRKGLKWEAIFDISKPNQINTTDPRLAALFEDLELNAYNEEFHNYYIKQANQIIRTHFEKILSCLDMEEDEKAIPKWLDAETRKKAAEIWHSHKGPEDRSRVKAVIYLKEKANDSFKTLTASMALFLIEKYCIKNITK